MKLITLSVLLLFTLSIQAQTKPQKQKVYSLVKVRHTTEWYEEQLDLWEEEVKTNPKNAEAWQNLFTASRMIKLCGGKKTQADLDAIVTRVVENIPGTFEESYLRYYNSGARGNLNDTTTRTNYLLKASSIDPNRIEAIRDFVAYYLYADRNEARLKEYCEKWFNSNDISPGILALNYNVLMSCDENAILITEGDNDTFPGLVLQYVKNIRKDVYILNRHLLFGVLDYRNKVFKELGIPAMTETYFDSDSIGVQKICSHIRKHSNRPFYYIIGSNPSIYSDVKDSIYMVGLVYKYSPERFDNTAVLRKNIEKHFLLDYLKIDLANDVSESVVNDMNWTYVAPFITLVFHYQDAGEIEKANALLEYINPIAEKLDLTEEVKKVLKERKL